MNRRILLVLILFTPLSLLAQLYGFNRQVIISYSSDKTRNVDTWFTPIEIEITTKHVIMRRPSNGAGEPELTDSLQIKSTNKTKDYFKIITKDERTIFIYGDELITMLMKEKDSKRVEYSFYNQKD